MNHTAPIQGLLRVKVAGDGALILTTWEGTQIPGVQFVRLQCDLESYNMAFIKVLIAVEQSKDISAGNFPPLSEVERDWMKQHGIDMSRNIGTGDVTAEEKARIRAHVEAFFPMRMSKKAKQAQRDNELINRDRQRLRPWWVKAWNYIAQIWRPNI